MADLLITNGRVFDPSQNLDAVADVLVIDGKVAFIGDKNDAQIKKHVAKNSSLKKFDATGKLVTPGLIDMHVHFREPGMEEEETIASGAAAAIAGGFTTVACMPNTEPAMDSEAQMNFVLRESRAHNLAEVFPVGAITAGRKGQALAEMANMTRGGAVAFSDDGCAVASAALLRTALAYAKMLDKPILEHCEEPTLAAGGVMNEGFVSTVLGLPAIPQEAEEIIVARDVHLAKLTGAHLHIQHVSTRGAIEIIRRAKSAGIKVTAEVTPHHLTLTDEMLRTFNSVYKVNPPLRTQDDVNACIEGLVDGTIDAIASDHAPHLNEEKEMEIAVAPFGLIGLETSFSVIYTHLIKTGKLTLARAITAMTMAPAKILKLQRGCLSRDYPANISVWDLEQEWIVDPQKFKSKSENCPWNGQKLFARPVAVILNGEIITTKQEKI